MPQQLYAIHGDKLVFVTETFWVDNQSVLNEHLAGRITEEEFYKIASPGQDIKQITVIGRIPGVPI